MIIFIILSESLSEVLIYIITAVPLTFKPITSDVSSAEPDRLDPLWAKPSSLAFQIDSAAKSSELAASFYVDLTQTWENLKADKRTSQPISVSSLHFYLCW